MLAAREPLWFWSAAFYLALIQSSVRNLVTVAEVEESTKANENIATSYTASTALAVTEIGDKYEYGLTPFWRTVTVILVVLLVFLLFFVIWLVHIKCFKHLQDQEPRISTHDEEAGCEKDDDSKINDNNDNEPRSANLRQYESSCLSDADANPEKMDYVGLLNGKKLAHVLSQSKMIKVKTNTGVENEQPTNNESTNLQQNKKKIGNTNVTTQEVPEQTGEHHDISDQPTVIISVDNTSTRDIANQVGQDYDLSNQVATVISVSDESAARASELKAAKEEVALKVATKPKRRRGSKVSPLAGVSLVFWLLFGINLIILCSQLHAF